MSDPVSQNILDQSDSRMDVDNNVEIVKENSQPHPIEEKNITIENTGNSEINTQTNESIEDEDNKIINDEENSVNNNDNNDEEDDLDDVMNDAINVIESTKKDLESDSNNNDSSVSQIPSSSSSASSRPRRKNAKNVNYKEKGPTFNTVAPETKRATKGRRSKNSSDSTSPVPQSASKKVSYYDVEEVVPINYQPPITATDDFNHTLDFNNAHVDEDEITLTLKDGMQIKKGDCIYMICEPPTEPNYIAQIMGFTKKDKNSNTREASNYMFSVCWFYRPRDLNRRLTDTRLVYASLHRDDCPLSSFRGFTTVKHKSDISDIEAYKKQPDCFYFDKLYDRYMIKMYDMIPTIQLVHLPSNYYKALHKRFEFIFVEVGKADELLSSPKNCEKCLQWSSNSDAIICSGCQKAYHLLCLDPPILTKPKRGFAWYCAACNKMLEDKLAESRGKMLESAQPSQIIKNENRLAMMKQSSEDEDGRDQSSEINEGEVDNNNVNSSSEDSSLKYEQLAKKFLESDKDITLKRRRELEEWPYRYLGVHAKFEDALDLQDRPYARASSRLGAKYQCTSISNWFDHKIQYYDTDNKSSNNNKKLKKYYNRSKKSTTPIPIEEDSLEKIKFPIPDEYKDIKPRNFPGWLQPKPKGYIERGGEDTSTLLWKMPNCSEDQEAYYEQLVDDYISSCSTVAKRLNLATETTPNFIDAILLILMRHDYKPEECMGDVNKLTRESLKEPTFTDEEVKRFEDSVRIHGSELFPVFKDVRTQPSAMVVRFYYLWKKTKNGHEIWDNFAGRAKNRLKNTKKVGIDLDSPEDDGIFSSEKIKKNKIAFKCIYCETNHSPQWFRAPGALVDEANNACEGFCYRCAKLWRKYATKWENPIELIKNQEKKAAYAVKKKTEFALIQEAELVVKARENYRLNPRPTSLGLKKFTTIDTDYNYNGVDESKTETPKKRAIRRSVKDLKSTLVSDEVKTLRKSGEKTNVKKEVETKDGSNGKPADFSDYVVNGFVNKVKRPRRAKVSKEKVVIPKPGNEGIMEFDSGKLEKKEDDGYDDDSVEGSVKKKRKYTRKKVLDKNLKFVYGKVIDDDDGKKKFTAKKNECFWAPIDESEYTEYDKAVEIVQKIDDLKTEIEENEKSPTFNAFLDMKLREKIEVLERDLSELKAIQTSNEYEKVSLELSVPNSSQSVSEPSSSRPTSKELEHTFPAGKRFVRRRVFLSKASVPGSGIFETPPIQLPMMDFNAPSEDTLEQSPEIANPDFQSPPTVLLPKSFQSNDAKKSPKKVNRGRKRDRPYNQLMNVLPMAKSNIKNITLGKESGKAFTGSSDYPGTASLTANSVNSAGANLKSSLISNNKSMTVSGSKSPVLSPSSFTIKGRQYLALVDSSETKPILSIIDCSDPASRKLFSRYVSKFKLPNPLITDDLNAISLYQLRPSGKEIQAAWKYLQSSKKTKIKFNKAFEPLFSADRRPCCVCRDLGDTSKMIICSNCGLNVHASCYGVELDSKMKKNAGVYNWHCDPCSNDLHALVSTQYVCLLCNSRESNMDSAIKGDPVSIPDALKRTAEGRWCHVLCSLLCDEIKYGSKSLQPIYGTSVVGLKNILNSCKVCFSTGGAVVKCNYCSNTTHVTCGFDFGWQVGFKLLKVFDVADGDVVEIMRNNAIGKLEPIICCDKHILKDSDIVPEIYKLTDVGRKINVEHSQVESLFELYASDERKLFDDKVNGLTRRKYYDQVLKDFEKLNNQVDEKLKNDNTFDPIPIDVPNFEMQNRLINVGYESDEKQQNLLVKHNHKCVQCSQTSSLLWYPNTNSQNGGTGVGEVCRSCHNNNSHVDATITIPELDSINSHVFEY